MYEAAADPHCYAGTTILKNIPGFRDAAMLERFEAVVTAQRAEEPLPLGRLDVRHYKAIHRHLFQDVYRWAGQLRKVRVSKGDSMFCYPENIGRELKALFSELRARRFLQGLAPEAFAAGAAWLLGELNAIHAFREGNGRSQVAFVTLLANQAGHPLAFEKADPDAFLAAMIASFKGNEQPLSDQIRALIMRSEE